MWQYIQERHPIWYFDATGSVMKKIGTQSMPYLYSIVCHDAFTKSIIPVAEFFTTSHSSLSITNELNFIRDTLITKIVSITRIFQTMTLKFLRNYNIFAKTIILNPKYVI